MSELSRREFLQSTTAIAAASCVPAAAMATQSGSATRPVVISSANGLNAATGKAMEMILAGGDTLDAVIAGVNLVEKDPKDSSVGYGGMPNEDGVVNAIDVTLILQRNAGLLGSLANEASADVNGDGDVTSIDATLLLQVIAGLLDEDALGCGSF